MVSKWASLVAQLVKNLSVYRTQVRYLSWKDLLEKRQTTHSSILAWRIPWTEEPGESIGSQRVGHHWRDLACPHAALQTYSLPLSHQGSPIYMVPLCLTFTETAKLFCKPAAPFYIPIKNVCVRVPISVHLHQHLLFSGVFFNALQ